MEKIKTKYFEKSIFKASRLIFDGPPEGDKPKTEAERRTPEAETPIPRRTPEQIKADKDKTKAQSNQKEDEEAKRAADELTKKIDKFPTFAKSYHEKLKENPTADDLEKIRLKAESDETSIADLQGGSEWMGVKMEQYEQKYGKLSQAYLKVEQKTDGKTILVVRDELNRSYKTKMNLGAGHLLPPSITAAAITDPSGNTRQGRREIRNGKVGYYDDEGYIPIFGGYKIEPMDFLDEKDPKFKQSIETEKQNYITNRDAMESYEDSGRNTPDEVKQYVGNTNHPVTSLRSLALANDKDMKDKGLNEKEIKNVHAAQEDYIRIEAILNNQDIRIDGKTETVAGNYLVSIEGKGAEMLGWSKESGKKETELFKKLSDQKHLRNEVKDLKDGEEKQLEEGLKIVKSATEKSGYYLKDQYGRKISDEKQLQKWCSNEAVKLSPKNNTIKLIEALQKGGEANTFLEYKFKGGYEFDITHLDTLYRLTKDAKGTAELTKILEKNKNAVGAVDSQKIIDTLFAQMDIPQGMSAQEAVDFINQNRHNLGFILGDQAQTVTLKTLLQMAKSKKPISVEYRWNAMQGADTYNVNGGKRCCAFTVSTLLGMGSPNGGVKGKEGNVRGLLSRLMASNKAKTGSEGIVFGFKNYQKGDVVIFRGTKEYATRAFSHVAIVRDRINIDGREYLIFIDEGKNFQANIVPVRRGTDDYKYLNHALATRKSELFSQHPSLRAVYNERKYVRVRPNNDWWGDAATGRGFVAFGVRTSGLTNS